MISQKERLDRAVGTHSWINLFPNYWVENLISPISDHSPIMLHTQNVENSMLSNNRIFRFENKWFQEDCLPDLVMGSWVLSSTHSLPDRLSTLAGKLSSWGRNLIATQRADIKDCTYRLSRLRESFAVDDVNTFEETKTKMVSLLLKDEEHWKQRAKLFWLKDGDANTKAFHAFANGRRKRNWIRRLKNDDGVWVTDENAIRNLATDYFNNLYSSSNSLATEMVANMPECVNEDDNLLLTAPFTMVEFKDALFQMQPDKAPGPDGFNPRFYQHFWSSIGDDIFEASTSWLHNRRIPLGVNDSIITLIPKCDEPKTMKDLRPIALCNVVLKIVTKVLANRLKKVLPKVIRENQSAFLKGRLITDNVLLAFEILHSMKRNTRKNGGMLL